ncbi:hypothetical protein [Hyphomonas sp.]|uniref:hypothetical protein n=1 Tax=Hyphomonas sp. TaxID=87 RepID=UPI0032427295
MRKLLGIGSLMFSAAACSAAADSLTTQDAQDCAVAKFNTIVTYQLIVQQGLDDDGEIESRSLPRLEKEIESYIDALKEMEAQSLGSFSTQNFLQTLFDKMDESGSNSESNIANALNAATCELPS